MSEPGSMTLRLRERTIGFPRRPLVMGIVNINDDSFSGDGTLDPDKALHLAADHIANGADIIDVGAESARPNRSAINEKDEITRLAPFMRRFRKLTDNATRWDDHQVWPPVLSINTWRPPVVEAALEMGAELINDMGALPDDRNARLCASTGAGLLIMHSVGAPKENHRDQTYPNIMRELLEFFEKKIELATSAGLGMENIILDPGIEFAKQPTDDLLIFNNLKKLRVFDRPILLPVSRKSVIGLVLDRDEPATRDAGSLACSVAGLTRGAAIMRVHNVRATAASIKVVHAAHSH